MPEASSALAEQFDSAEQQREAATLGMWTFIATEIMFFGGLFIAYLVYRTTNPGAFAVGSQHCNVLLGTMNTAILLTSSLTVALAGNAAQKNSNRALIIYLLVTMFLGFVFLALKGLEYHEHISHHLFPGASFSKAVPPRTEMFFYLYFAMTGLHALHVLIGICVFGVMTLLACKRRFSAAYHTPVELAGLYWHFVDIVWVFLYPLLYLINRHAVS